jgi:hypothetical protein
VARTGLLVLLVVMVAAAVMVAAVVLVVAAGVLVVAAVVLVVAAVVLVVMGPTLYGHKKGKPAGVALQGAMAGGCGLTFTDHG